MTLLRSKAAWATGAVLLAGVATGTVTPVRDAALRQVGRSLLWADPLSNADAIVITVDAGAAGVLEAADLVKRGIASRVAVFAEPPEKTDSEFLKRGVPYEDEASRSTRQLLALGVPHVERIGLASGTQEEGEVLPSWCAQRGIRSVVVVCEPDHSRRLSRVLARTMNERLTSVMIRPTQYSKYEAETWWYRRSGIRTQIVESQKLLLDYALHPF